MILQLRFIARNAVITLDVSASSANQKYFLVYILTVGPGFIELHIFIDRTFAQKNYCSLMIHK